MGSEEEREGRERRKKDEGKWRPYRHLFVGMCCWVVGGHCFLSFSFPL